MPDRTDWATGKNTEFRPLVFSFPPLELVRHLSPGFSAGDMGSLANDLTVSFTSGGNPISAGVPLPDGTFEAETVFAAVDERLREMARTLKEFE